MAKVKIEGVEVEIAGDEISQEEFEFLTDLKKEYKSKLNPSGVSDEDINPETGYYNLPEVSSKIRFAVSAAPNLKSKVATLENFFSKVTQDEYDPTNFILEDANGKKFILDDKSKTNFGDVIDEGKFITQAVTSTGGAIAGSVLGPGGAVAGSGIGLAAGSEFYERIGQIAGTEIDRDIKEYATTRGLEFLLGSTAQAAGPLLIRGVKYVFKSDTDRLVFKKIAEEKGLSTKEAEKFYKSFSKGDKGLTEKINQNLPLTMADRLSLFNKYGTKATLGQVTENNFFDTIETTFANVPFAAPSMRASAEKAQDQLGKTFTRKVLDSLKIPTEAGKKFATSSEAAGVIKRGLVGTKLKRDFRGRTIKEYNPGDTKFGIYNAEGSIQNFRHMNDVNYGAVKNAIGVLEGNQKNIKLDKTLAFLKEQADSPKGLENFYKLINDPKIAKMYQTLSNSVGKDGTLKYEAVDKLRQTVGQKLLDPVLFDTLPRSAFKKLYGALKDDIQISLGKITGTKGTNLLKRLNVANSYYDDQLKIIDRFVEPIAKRADVDNIVKQLIAKSKEGDTTLSNIMREIGPERSKVLISSIMGKMGEVPSTGQLAALGRTNLFNTQNFIKNYDALSDEAKKTLFENTGLFGKGNAYSKLKSNLEEVKALSTYIERQNPFKDLGQTATKGTAGTGLLVGGGAAATIGTGDPLFLLGIPLFGYGGSLAVKILSNPAFLEWISRGVKIAGNKGLDGVIEHMTKLGVVAGMSDDDTANVTNQYLEIIKKTTDKVEEESKQQMNQQNQQAEQNLQQTATGAPSAPSAPAPVNTQVTDPLQYGALFPQDSLGQAIAQRKVI
jgi:hypothetical protein